MRKGPLVKKDHNGELIIHYLPSLTLTYLAFVWQLFSSRARLITYVECNGEVIIHSASNIIPVCNTLFGIFLGHHRT